MIAGYLNCPDLKVGVIEKPERTGLQPKMKWLYHNPPVAEIKYKQQHKPIKHADVNQT